MVIREATRDDAALIADIVIACWRHAYRGVLPDEALDRDTREERTARIARNPWPTFVAVVDDRVVGMMRMHDAEIDGLYVLPDAARAGIGRALVKFACERLRAQGRTSLFIATLRDNQIGRAFYERLGGTLVEAPPWTYEGVDYPSVGYYWTDLARVI